MKNIFPVLTISFLLCACSPNSTQTSASQVTALKTRNSHTILFYNVENLFDTVDDKRTNDDDFLPTSDKSWNEERFQSKIEKLSTVIAAVDKNGPVLIGMVEVENEQVVKELLNTKTLENVNYDIAHFNSPDERGIDVALAYDADYFQLLSKEALNVELTDNDKTRDILYVKGKVEGETLHIFVNHWPSRGGGAEKSEPKRIKAASVLRKKIDQIQRKNNNAKIIVMGDFNDYPTNNSITETLNARDNYPNSSSELFNLAAELEKNDKGSYNYRGDWGMLDQMMVSQTMLSKKTGGFYLEKNGLKIFDEEFILFYDKKYKEFKPNKTYGGSNYYGGYSDHLPIYIELKK